MRVDFTSSKNPQAIFFQVPRIFASPGNNPHAQILCPPISFLSSSFFAFLYMEEI